MLAPWVVEEMNEADLNDERLNRRLNRILSDLAERPTASIPAACGGKNEMTAAYNFFNNEKAIPPRILEPHYHSTQRRIAAQPMAILVPDTTELDLTRPQQQVKGAGPLDDGARRGVLVHLMEAFSEDGTPLGAVWSEMWTRDEPKPPTNPPQPPRNHKLIPIEDKESYRWLESLRQARAVAARRSTARSAITLGNYRTSGHVVRAADRAPSVPASLSGIVRGVIGLTPGAHAPRRHRRRLPPSVPVVRAASTGRRRWRRTSRTRSADSSRVRSAATRRRRCRAPTA